ncbi:MAG: hypothetical protein KA236_14925 [Verrucomicrobia bacterium]|jgi:hypothetical protein|nr:hypothetical protein [Verrucomicrobiota bacterium]
MLNAAGFATLVTVFGCAGIAGLVAASEKAGWFTVLFVAGGLAAGFGFAFGVHKLAYRLLDVCGRQSGAALGWVCLLAYSVVPLLIACGAIVLTGWLTFLFVRHIL